jgi:hypothetical protein
VSEDIRDFVDKKIINNEIENDLLNALRLSRLFVLSHVVRFVVVLVFVVCFMTRV